MRVFSGSPVRAGLINFSEVVVGFSCVFTVRRILRFWAGFVGSRERVLGILGCRCVSAGVEGLGLEVSL